MSEKLEKIRSNSELEKSFKTSSPRRPHDPMRENVRALVGRRRQSRFPTEDGQMEQFNDHILKTMSHIF